MDIPNEQSEAPSFPRPEKFSFEAKSSSDFIILRGKLEESAEFLANRFAETIEKFPEFYFALYKQHCLARRVRASKEEGEIKEKQTEQLRQDAKSFVTTRSQLYFLFREIEMPLQLNLIVFSKLFDSVKTRMSQFDGPHPQQGISSSSGFDDFWQKRIVTYFLFDTLCFHFLISDKKKAMSRSLTPERLQTRLQEYFSEETIPALFTSCVLSERLGEINRFDASLHSVNHLIKRAINMVGIVQAGRSQNLNEVCHAPLFGELEYFTGRGAEHTQEVADMLKNGLQSFGCLLHLRACGGI